MVLFDPHSYAYPSRRSVVYARRAMACTSVPLGAQVGLDVMKAGGNAVDAAVAMAAAMPLLGPTGNGIGGDCFARGRVELAAHHGARRPRGTGRAQPALRDPPP